MYYLWILAGMLVVLVAVAFSPIKAPRRPGLEREFDIPAAKAYDRMGMGLIFGSERRLATGQLAKLAPTGTMLDAGCGPGYLLREISYRFPGLSLIGLDFNPCVIDLARTNLAGRPINLVCARAENMPFADNSIDMVISTGTLHHWPDTYRVLREFYRVLKPGGTIFLMDLRRDCPRVFYGLIYVAHWFMPVPTRRTNGPRGSFWASYTIPEVNQIMAISPFSNAHIKAGFGWFFVTTSKG